MTPKYDDLDPGPAPMPNVRWNIGREGRAWGPDEALGRWKLTPEKFEMDRGKLWKMLEPTKPCGSAITRCGERRFVT